MFIYNIYKGNAPFPNSDWLEMAYIDYIDSKQEYNSLKKKKMLKKYTVE